MDRFNCTLHNAGHYSQIYQEDDQHAFQPEAGQTSAGPSWSHPAPGQPRPYLDLNFPPLDRFNCNPDADSYYSQLHQEGGQSESHPTPGWPQPLDLNRPPTIPPSPRSDREYLLRTQQPIALEAGIQNDALPQSFNPQATAERRRGKTSAQVKEQFLAGLEKYAQGYKLKYCSATIPFRIYITDGGELHDRGRSVYSSMLPGEREQLDRAIESRIRIISDRSKDEKSVQVRFLAALENYKSGVSLRQCAEDIRLSNYITTDGKLRKKGRVLYDTCDENVQARINQALATRKGVFTEACIQDIPHFLNALVPYGNGLDLLVCGIQSGLKKKAEQYLTPVGGLTPKGELLVENLPPEQQNYVLHKLEQRRQRTVPSTQVQGAPWQRLEMPALMPEMGVMNQAAMNDPMQTEAMIATAWQFTGQTIQGMQGTWWIPSESAESPIPYYGSDAVGRDFQHQYGPYGLMPQLAPDCLIGRGILPGALINIQGEVYRVQGMGSSSVGSTNENPYGNSFMLVPRMWGG
ncbi:MAG: hypothetical protein P8X89_01990 [Reinekea sp.]